MGFLLIKTMFLLTKMPNSITNYLRKAYMDSSAYFKPKLRRLKKSWVNMTRYFSIIYNAGNVFLRFTLKNVAFLALKR